MPPAQCQRFDFALIYLLGKPSTWRTLEEGKNDVGFICT